MICRLGLVRIRQIPGSRLRIFAASSNSVSIASKRLPEPPCGAIGDEFIISRPLARVFACQVCVAARYVKRSSNFRSSSVYQTSELCDSADFLARLYASLYDTQVISL